MAAIGAAKYATQHCTKIAAIKSVLLSHLAAPLLEIASPCRDCLVQSNTGFKVLGTYRDKLPLY